MASASIPPPPPPPLNGGTLLGSAVVVTAKEYLHSISQKLTNSNYLLWCQQVEPVLKGHHLYHLLAGLQIPPRHLTIADCNAGITSSFGSNKISFFCRGYSPLFLVKFFHDSSDAKLLGIFGISFIHISTPLFSTTVPFLTIFLG